MLLVFLKQCDEIEFPNAVDSTQQLLTQHSTQKNEIEQELQRIKTYACILQDSSLSLFSSKTCEDYLTADWVRIDFFLFFQTSAIHQALECITRRDIWSIIFYG